MFKIIRGPSMLQGPALEIAAPAPAPAPTPFMTKLEEAPPAPQILLPCPVCFRTFAVQSLDRHKNVCQKVATKKRKVFDSSKQRVGDLPDVIVSSPTRNVPTTSPFSRNGSRRYDSSPIRRINPTWKDQHLSLIKTVREARAAESTRCPFCERNFGTKAFDRHLDWCREQQSRIPKSPTNCEAKERWEARTKYRAPPLRRSVRSLTRDKYSPTRSLYGGENRERGISQDRLTVADCGGGGGAQSLSGSRQSLASQASSSYSYQTDRPTYERSPSKNRNYFNNISNIHNSLNSGGGSGNKSAASSIYGGSSTLGRVGGSNFLRQANERRSLRSSPSSPPPSLLLHQREQPTPVVTLTPINNNRTSALRASLRMKNPFTSLSSSFLASSRDPRPIQPPIKAVPIQQPQQQPAVIQSAPSSASNSKRPTVLQLFTSAFSRPSPVAVAKNRTNPPSSAVHSIHQQQQGRRFEPEGVESKLNPYSSCHTNSYQPLSLGSITGNKVTPSSSAPQPPARTSSHSRYGLLEGPSYERRGSLSNTSSSSNYNPYLSAERQMAELFQDPRPSSRMMTKEAYPPERRDSPPPVPEPSNKSGSKSEETASMEQLELDLKSILSEISQLGSKDRESVSNAWNAQKSSNSGKKEKVESPVGSAEPPKFCHLCGSSYPEHYVVKFCCQCGSKRLYI